MSKLVFLGINFIAGVWVISLSQKYCDRSFLIETRDLFNFNKFNTFINPVKLEKLKKVTMNL